MPVSIRHLITLLTCLAVQLVGRADASDAFADATRLYQAGQWATAAAAFDQLAGESQRDRSQIQQACLYSGECFVQLGKYAEARQRYQRVHDQAPGGVLGAQSLFRLGEVAWLSGELVEAKRLLQLYVQKYPAGGSLSFANDYLLQIRERAELEANFESLNEAVRWEREGQPDTALTTYRKLLKQLPKRGEVHAEALRRAALLCERLSERSEAIEFYRQYLAEYPHSKRTADVLLAVAWNYDALHQTAQAADQFQAVLVKFPQSAQAATAAYWLAQKSADDGYTEQAIRQLESVLAPHQPAEGDAELYGRAVCLRCQLHASKHEWKEIDELAKLQRELLSDGPLKTKLDFWAAEAAFRLRNYKDARDRFASLQSRVVEIEQAWIAIVPLRRAQLAARRQQWSEVLRILDRLEREHTDFELDYEVDYLRGRALAGLGKMTAARKYYRRVQSNPKATNTEAATMAGWMIGESFFHQRDYPRARMAYETVMEETSFAEWQSRAALQAGKCWELEQRWDEASRVYAQALESWPNTDSQPQLESRLRWAEAQTGKEPATKQR